VCERWRGLCAFCKGHAAADDADSLPLQARGASEGMAFALFAKGMTERMGPPLARVGGTLAPQAACQPG